MKYIDKTKLHAPTSYVRELQAAHLDEANILSYYPTEDGRRLFERVKALPSHVYRTMRQQLLQDQGYVCCYCNRSIPIPGHIVVTEHVKPVSIYKQLAGEYKNLLVTCDGGELIPPTPVGVTPPYTRTTYPLHCDKAKDNQEIPVSPLDAGCENRFVYDPLSGKINGAVGDTDAARTVAILNLNHDALKRERKKEIKSWCYNRSGNLLNYNQLSAIFYKMLTPDANGHYYNLYYVIASAAMNLAV